MTMVVLNVLVASVAFSAVHGSAQQSSCPRQSHAQSSTACSEERTSLLQTVTAVQKRGPAAASALEVKDKTRVAGAGEHHLLANRALLISEGQKVEALNNIRGELRTLESHLALEVGDLQATQSKMLHVLAINETSHKPLYEPSPPPPPQFIFAGQIVTAVAAGLAVLLVLFSCCDFKSWLPQPSPMTQQEIEEFKDERLPWFFMCSYVAVQMMTTDQYLPSMGKMEVDFKTTPELMSFTLQVNWIVKAVSAVAMAFFADKYGRKTMLIFCSLFTCLGSLSCAAAPSVSWFIAGRVFQGIAEGGEPLFAIIARDMIEDIGERMQYMSGNFAILFLVPTIAPAAGGMLAYYSGSWRLPFLVLAGWGLLNTLAFPCVMAETQPDGASEKTSKDYRTELKRVMFDKHIMVLALIEGMALMVIFSVDTNFSLIMSNVFHMNQFQTSVKLAIIAAILIPGSVLPPALADCFGTANVLRGALVFALVPIVGCFMVGAFVASAWQPIFVCVCVCQLVAICCVIMGNSLYFQPIGDLSGAAAGINTCLCTLMSSAGTAVSSLIVQYSGHEVECLAMWLGGSLLGLFVIFWPCFGMSPPKWAMPPEDEIPEETATRPLK